VWGALIFACGFFIVEFGLEGAWGRAFAALATGVVLVAVALHWKQVSPNWVIPSAITVILVLALSPYVAQHRWPFAWLVPASPQVPPSAQQNAAAIAPLIKSEIEGLRTSLGTPTETPPRAPAATPLPAYVNPIHDDASKWKVAHELRRYYSLGIPECKIVIVRYQTDYDEVYAADLKDLLSTVGWPFEERFASSTLPRGMTIRAVRGGMTSRCAGLLAGTVRVFGRPAPGAGQPPIDQSEIVDLAKAPDYLKTCGDNCLEVSLGLAPELSSDR
jgi:hypothetical protein